MILLVGLGNPGSQYEFNRHNIGYRIINALATQLGDGSWESDSYYFDSQFLTVTANEHEVRLVKPGTFMNESGQPVGKYITDKEIGTENVWVIQDETEIPFGEVRIKFGGTSGGHNGIKSIDDAIGTEYWRIRVGVGRPESHNFDLADYVLANFTAEENEKLNTVIDQTVSYLVKSLEEGQINATSFNTQDATK